MQSSVLLKLNCVFNNIVTEGFFFFSKKIIVSYLIGESIRVVPIIMTSGCLKI
jgi:hypothetical protein